MAVKPKSGTKEQTPEARLRAWIERSGPEDQKLIRAIRAALRKRLPAANELAYDYKSFIVLSYTPTDHGKDGVVSFAARPDGMRLYFNQGPKLPDPKKLLLGAGTQTRYVTLESARRVSHPDVEAFIAAAIEHSKAPLPSRGKGALVIRTDSEKKKPRPKPAR